MELENIIGSGNSSEFEQRRGRGRPKGSLNKVTASAKTMIEEAAKELGGSARMVAWAKEAPENERAFWSTIFTKLLPVQLAGEGGGALQIVIASRDADL
jgi:hypothetical protein